MDLLQQQMSSHHSNVNPAAAPRLDVRISSPEPTMLPAMTTPGPRCRRRASRPAGGGRSAAAGVV
jgi:hypothetical protein